MIDVQFVSLHMLFFLTLKNFNGDSNYRYTLTRNKYFLIHKTFFRKIFIAVINVPGRIIDFHIFGTLSSARISLLMLS